MLDRLLILLRLLMGCVCGKEAIEIDGRQFYIRKRLGEGGFSVVYMVQEHKTGKLFALKRVVCHSARDERRVLDEINLHKALDLKHNANIISCEGYASSKLTSHRAIIYPPEERMIVDSVEYNILLPYFKRGTLLDELAFRQVSGDHIAESRLIRLFSGVCNAVRDFHSLEPEPYAHRDIKPGNVLLANDDSAVLMDFGSASLARQTLKDAKQAQALRDYAAEQCSMPYRAPELFHAEAGSCIDEKTDIWALGCLLFAMCFFKSPFDVVYERGDSVALAVLTGNIQIPNNSPYSASIHNLILKMIRVESKERPTANDIVEELDLLSKRDIRVV